MLTTGQCVRASMSALSTPNDRFDPPTRTIFLESIAARRSCFSSEARA
jgi:hypothetical protein